MLYCYDKLGQQLWVKFNQFVTHLGCCISVGTGAYEVSLDQSNILLIKIQMSIICCCIPSVSSLMKPESPGNRGLLEKKMVPLFSLWPFRDLSCYF